MKLLTNFFIGLILFFTAGTCFAQGENNIWYFGTGAGINFNGGTPMAVGGGNTNSMEGSASVCNKAGNLLFYSNGNTVWDKNNGTMPNGSGIIGNGPNYVGTVGSSTQGVGIVPFVGDTNKYYLFTLDAAEEVTPTYPGYLRYSVIDMSLNGGLGDVVAGQKNIVVDSFMSEKMVEVRGGGCYTWLVTHKYGSNKWQVYKIDGTGLNVTPVVSNAGYLATTAQSYMYSYACVSQDNQKLAAIQYCADGGTILGTEIYSFNNATGVVSDAQVIDSDSDYSFDPYSVCFSPDNSRLYVSSVIQAHLYQYNLALLPNLAAVTASKVDIYPSGFGGLRMGPDGKIYTHLFSLSAISCINDPNGLGPACNFSLSALPCYGGSNFFYGLGEPVVVSDFSNVDTITQTTDTALCLGSPVIINAPVGYSSYMWSDGSSQQSDQFTAAGIKWVIAQQGCTTLVDTFNVIAKPTDTSFITTDTLVCISEPINITAPNGYDNYLWSDGSTAQTNSFTNAGTVWVFAKKDCEGIMDTIKIRAAHIDTVINVTDTTVCFQPSVTFTAPAGYDAYLWSDGTKGQTDNISHTSINWVAAGKGCNVAIDTFTLTLTNFNIVLHADTAICAGDSLMLNVNTDAHNANYLWQDGSITAYYTVTMPDTYKVQVSENGCIKTALVVITPRTLKVDFGADVTLCNKDSMKLDAGTTGANYLWQDGSKEQTYEVTQAGTYWVQEQLASCTASDTINIGYENCVCQTFVADAFTPNNDSKNDKLGVHVDCDVTGYKFMIFNRWGQRVFYSQDVSEKWDGTFSGVPVEVGTYYYQVSYTGVKNKKYFEKGNVTLIR